MKAKCEACGTWVEESYTHVINEQCLCVLCALRVEEYQDAGDDWEINEALKDFPAGFRE
jgi:hypothetical protein